MFDDPSSARNDTLRTPSDDDPAGGGVVIRDDNRVRADLYALWSEPVPTVVVSSREDLLATVDSSHLVLCLSGVGERSPAPLGDLRARAPHLQVLGVFARDEPAAAAGPDFDETLVEPFGRDAYRAAVERLLRRALYSFKVHQFYRLNALLVTERRWADGAETDVHVDSLRASVDRLEGEIAALSETLDGDDFDALLRTLDARGQHSTEPTDAPATTHRSKYHPPACPNCGLEWGVPHENDLEFGYERIASFVWECTRCGHVTKTTPGEYDKVL